MDNTEAQKNNLFGGNKAILFILLDAFRWDYLNPKDTPTLDRVLKNSLYVKKLMSSPGFTQRSAIFTGAPPDIHGNYTMYTYNRRTSPYKILRFFKPILSVLPKGSFLYKISRKFINQIPKFTTDWAPPGHIPSQILPLISVVEDLHPIYQPNSLPIESLFDVFTREGVKYQYLMAPVSGIDDETMQKLQQKVGEKNDATIFFAQFSDTDGLVHKFGVNSPERPKIVRQVDDRIKNLIEQFENRFENPWVIVIGDHGMVDIKEYLDIWNPINEFSKKNGLTNGKDFLMFLDSTLARFWFFKPGVKEIFTPFLLKLVEGKGVFLTDELMKKQRIPLNKSWYGDLIWRANVGVGIFPDYFHNQEEKYKGMHGFSSVDDSMKGAAVIYNSKLEQPRTIEEGCLWDLPSTICDILAVPYPKNNEGKSFFSNLNL